MLRGKLFLNEVQKWNTPTKFPQLFSIYWDLKFIIKAWLKTNVNAGEKFPSRVTRENIKYFVIKQHELCAQQNPSSDISVALLELEKLITEY